MIHMHSAGLLCADANVVLGGARDQGPSLIFLRIGSPAALELPLPWFRSPVFGAAPPSTPTFDNDLAKFILGN